MFLYKRFLSITNKSERKGKTMKSYYAIFYKKNNKVIGPWSYGMWATLKDAKEAAEDCKQIIKAKVHIRKQVWKKV